jgi:hypothetical protein
VRRVAVIPLLLWAALPLYGQSNLVFPHLAVGGTPTYETVLQLMNEVGTDNPIVIDVYQGRLSGSANGNPLAVRFDGSPASASRSVTLSPYQELATVLTGDTTALKVGWLRVRSTIAGGKISGTLLFRQRSGNTLLDSVGVGAAQRFRRAVIQVDQRETGSNTGLAFANPDDSAVTVTLDLFQGSTRVASPILVTLQPNQHYTRLFSEIYPFFGAQQGTLILEAAPSRAVPVVALRLDGSNLTSIPVRPLGFSFQYSVTGEGGATTESGWWIFDLAGFNVMGTGKIEFPASADISDIAGSWAGTNFQFSYRKLLRDGTTGTVVFGGISAGQESTVGVDGKEKAVIGKAITIGADGQTVSVGTFTAFHKFGSGPQ